MGFPVSDQVDLVLPLLGLKTMLGASVMANTTAAEDDDDGPYQPEPCSKGEQVLSTVYEPHPNPGHPTRTVGKVIRKPGSKVHTALKAGKGSVPGGLSMHLSVWVAATLAALTELGNSVPAAVQCGVPSVCTTPDNNIWRQGSAPLRHCSHSSDIISSSQKHEQSCE